MKCTKCKESCSEVKTRFVTLLGENMKEIDKVFGQGQLKEVDYGEMELAASYVLKDLVISKEAVNAYKKLLSLYHVLFDAYSKVIKYLDETQVKLLSLPNYINQIAEAIRNSDQNYQTRCKSVITENLESIKKITNESLTHEERFKDYITVFNDIMKSCTTHSTCHLNPLHK